MDGVKAVVCDIGSKMSKVGFAGECCPRTTFPSVVGRFRQAGLLDALPDVYFGRDALENQGFCELTWPMKNGMVQNWYDMERLWYHTFYTALFVPPESTNIMCVIHPLTPSKDRMKMAEILFEAFTVKALYIGTSPAMVLYASGRSTGVVWESGASTCLTTAVYEGYPLTFTVTNSPLTGDAITNTLLKMLSDLGYLFTTPTEIQIIEKIKARQCYVAADFTEEFKKPVSEAPYKLPNGDKITIGDCKFRCAEILFQPSLGGFECPNIIDNIFSCISKVDLDIRGNMYENIVLAGGSSLFPGLEQRMSGEMKVRLLRMPQGARRGEARVEAMPARENAAWAGGSILASMEHLHGLWMTASEYDDMGPGGVNQKFY